MVMKMKKMNKKVLKIFSCLILFALLFSIDHLSVSAKITVKSGEDLFEYDVTKLVFYNGVSVSKCKDDVCDIKYGNNTLSLPKAATSKKIEDHQVHYRVFYDEDNKEQLYCIEQGVAFSKSGVEKSQVFEYLFIRKTKGVMTNSSECSSDKNKNIKSDEDIINCETKYRKKLIAQVISVGYHSINPSTSDFSQYKNIATQELIWEIARGERNVSSFSKNNYMPNKTCSSDKSYCPFYSKLFVDNSTKNDTKIIKVRNAYKDIIDKVYYTYYNTPNSFAKTEKKAKTINLSTYDSSTKKYFVTLSNNEYKKYKNFTFSTNDKNVSVSLNGNKLTITSTKPLTSEVLITASYKYENNLAKLESNKTWNFKSKKRGTGNNAYGLQAVATGASQATYYLKVTTPSYSIKINKKDSLTKNALANVSFNICYNVCDCKKPTVVKTDSNGTYTLSNIKNAGKYCIQEKEQTNGYINNNTKYYVDLPSKGNNNASVNIDNTPNEFELTKQILDSDGIISNLNDNCGENDNRAEFQIKDNSGKIVSFKSSKNGEYNANLSAPGSLTDTLKTCNGKIKVYTMKKGKYIITETKFPEGVQAKENSKEIDITANKSKYFLTITNGFTGLEFQKKDEDGNLISGGKFSLQMKVNNIYKDVLLLKKEDGNYKYSSNLKSSDNGVTYELVTKDGILRVSNLPVGEYRVVEKEAPEGYESIKDRDSKAIAKITDSNKDDYVVVEMINHKTSKEGDSSSAELILTIITGRKIINYVYVFGALTALIILLIYLRKKLKK